MRVLTVILLLCCALMLDLKPQALADVKKGDPGATCSTSKGTVAGQPATCETCKATKCDTSGNQVTNCRIETTRTCTQDVRTRPPRGTMQPGTTAPMMRQ